MGRAGSQAGTPCQAGLRAGDRQSSPASINGAKMLKTSTEITSPGQGITVQLFSLKSKADTSRPLFSSSPWGEITHTLKMSGLFSQRKPCSCLQVALGSDKPWSLGCTEWPLTVTLPAPEPVALPSLCGTLLHSGAIPVQPSALPYW